MLLTTKLKKLVQENLTKEEIYQALLSQKYTLIEIEQAFLQIKTEQTESRESEVANFKNQIEPEIQQNQVESNLNKQQSQGADSNSYLNFLIAAGSIITGLGLISLVAANWAFLPGVIKILLLFTLLLIVYSLGFLWSNAKKPALAEGMFVLGSLIFGANIFLVSQIYNLPIAWQDGFLYWFAGTATLALVRKSYSLFLVSVLIFIVTTFTSLPYILISYLWSYTVSQSSSYLAVILAIVPSLVIAFWFKKETEKDFKRLSDLTLQQHFWKKIFFSKNDLFKEAFAVVSLTFVQILGWRVFIESTLGFDFSQSTAVLELTVFVSILLALVFGFWMKSYWVSTLSVIAAYIFLIVEMINWGYNFYFVGSGGYLHRVSPFEILAFAWIVLNLIYVLGKYLIDQKWHARTGLILRFIIITVNLVVLGFLSNYLFFFRFREGLAEMPSLPFFTSLPLVIVSLNLVGLLILVLYWIYKKVIDLNFYEIIASFIPAVVLLFFSLIGIFQAFALESGNVLSILWLLAFNLLFFTYPIYLILKGGKSGQSWLRIFGIFLFVIAIIYKFFDLSTSFSFRGFFFILFGIFLLIGTFVLNQVDKQIKNK